MSSRAQKVSDEEIIRVFKDSSEHVLTASEVADQLPVTRQLVNLRLNELEEGDILESKSSGSGKVWWIHR